jgi:dihydrofolate reductase
MRPVTYFVASSLDGRTADPASRFDWLLSDQGGGVARQLEAVDTVLMGQATYDAMRASGLPGYPGKTNIVFSRTLDGGEHPGVWIIDSAPGPFVKDLRRAPGRGIWIVGDPIVLRYLLLDGLVDRVVVAVHPLLLGEGDPFLPASEARTPLHLEDVAPDDSGLVTLTYSVLAGDGEDRVYARTEAAPVGR